MFQEVFNAETNSPKQKPAKVIEVDVKTIVVKFSATENINTVSDAGNISTTKLKVSATIFAGPIANSDP